MKTESVRIRKKTPAELIGGKIRKGREARDQTQDEFGHEAGLTGYANTKVSQIEAGQRATTVAHFMIVAQLLRLAGVDLNALIDDREK